MSKKERVGRIFLDNLRNDTKSTAVAPLSTRARLGATVSIPVAWSAVRKGVDPARFTIRTVPSLLKKSQPWGGYNEAGVSLRSLIQRLLEKKR